jgi:hypothetical protein
MCIKRLIQYACGHAEKEFYNRHCWCALIVGPIVGCRERCGRVCGGRDEVVVEFVVVEFVVVEVVVEVEVEFEVEAEGVRDNAVRSWRT